MTWQTILIVTAWVFSVIAISVAFGASKQAGETESLAWRLNKEDRESRMREIGNREQISYRLYALEAKGREFEERINSITEEKDCEPCRPRTCCGTAGDKAVMLVTNEDEIAKNIFWKHQYRELSAKYDQAVEENKRLRDTIETVARVSGYHDKKKGE